MNGKTHHRRLLMALSLVISCQAWCDGTLRRADGRELAYRDIRIDGTRIVVATDSGGAWLQWREVVPASLPPDIRKAIADRLMKGYEHANKLYDDKEYTRAAPYYQFVLQCKAYFGPEVVERMSTDGIEKRAECRFLSNGLWVTEAEQTSIVKQEFEQAQLAKGLVIYAGQWIPKAQADSSATLAAAMNRAREAKTYESAIDALQQAVAANPHAVNLDEASEMLKSLKEAHADAIAVRRQEQEVAARQADLRKMAWESSENLALYLKQKLAKVYSRDGTKPFLSGTIRSGDVSVGVNSASATFRLLFGDGSIEVPEVRLGFTKDFGAWVLSEVTARGYTITINHRGQMMTSEKRMDRLSDMFDGDGVAAYMRYLVGEIAKIDFRE